MSLIKNIDFSQTLESQGVTVSGEITAERKAGGPAGYYLQVTPPTGTAGSGYVGYYEHDDINLAPGETIFYSAYIRGLTVALCWPLGEGVYNWAYIHKMVTGTGILLWSDSSGFNSIATASYSDWHHAIIQFTRANAGGQNGVMALWINGVLIDCVDAPNFDTQNMGRLRSVSFAGSGKAGYFDLADIRVGQTLADVEPYCPSPESDYVDGRRLLIVYRDGDSDSRSFAEYAAEKLGSSLSQLCPVPSGQYETVFNFTTFQADIENPIKQFLADRPKLASQVTTLLLCPGVTGYYGSMGKNYSATARLSNMGFTRDGITLNPLAGSNERITRDKLGVGRYMVMRIDADSFLDSKSILDKTDAKIHLDNSAASAESLRGGGSACRAALLSGDMAAAGMSDMPADDERIDSEAFYSMLHAGGTLAEAVYVASSHLDGQIVAVGNPLLKLDNQSGRYFFLGEGSPAAIDWERAVHWVPVDEDSAQIDATLQPGVKYALGVRASSAGGTEEHNTHVISFLEVDSEDELQPAPLPKPFDVTADVVGGMVQIGFSCQVSAGYASPGSFEIFGDSGSGEINYETPLAEVSNIAAGQTDFVLNVPAEIFPCKFAVRARHEQQAGPLSGIVQISASRLPSPPNVL